MMPRAGLAVVAMLLVAGCVKAVPPDYHAFRAHQPRSILVLPPVNQTTNVVAPYSYLSTMTRPLAECGYYVFPVAVVDAFMRENGLPGAAEMQAAPLEKIRDVLGADAVLYITLDEWGQKYIVISSNTVVRAHASLVDVATGTPLWSGTVNAVQSSSAGQTNILAMLITAAITQVVDSMVDSAHDLARVANHGMVLNGFNGMLLGPYHPGSQADARGR